MTRRSRLVRSAVSCPIATGPPRQLRWPVARAICIMETAQAAGSFPFFCPGDVKKTARASRLTGSLAEVCPTTACHSAAAADQGAAVPCVPAISASLGSTRARQCPATSIAGAPLSILVGDLRCSYATGREEVGAKPSAPPVPATHAAVTRSLRPGDSRQGAVTCG